MTPAEEDEREPIVCLAGEIEAGVNPVSNRRIHERLKASDLHWLRSARVKYGEDVRVLDLSAGGMLIETRNELACDANLVVELTASNPILIPSRVVRCRVASMGEILRYHGACAFKRPLTLAELVPVPPRPATATPARQTPAAATAAASWQKVVARYMDGRVLCGYTNNFHPSKPQLHLFPNPRQGESTFVPMAQLKALFFVREFAGDPRRVEKRDFVDPLQGRKVEVTFHDNEVLVGTTLGYRGEGNGFFVHPADPRSNNIRIFVSASGTRQVRFLP